MNRQDTKKGRGIEWCSVYGWPGYTANPVRGCKHDCRWTMPDGAIAECYAKTVAERVAQAAYPNGFAHIEYRYEVLTQIRNHKKPAAIFIDSMSDLMGTGVEDIFIWRVIEMMRDCPQHIFFVLTKNHPRLKAFKWPENAWIGVSAPPSFMYGKALSLEQQQKWYDAAFKNLAQIDVPVRWTSIEPLSWDVAPILERHRKAFDWAVIGAATNGRETHQPDEKIFKRALFSLGGKPVFFKGNLDRTLANRVAGRWCEEYPLVLSDWRGRRDG